MTRIEELQTALRATTDPTDRRAIIAQIKTAHNAQTISDQIKQIEERKDRGDYEVRLGRRVVTRAHSRSQADRIIRRMNEEARG